jgi:hypothetical protein
MRYPVYLSASLAVVLCACVVGLAPELSSAPFPLPQQIGAPSSDAATTTIPGPLRSFLRMAGVSQKIPPEEVLPLLARNIFLRGYEGQGSSLRATEFMVLLRRYVEQARELASAAGPTATIRVSDCEEGQRLLQILGYRARPGCGQSRTYLETADPQRAFLTIDSGFPLPDLERTLAGGAPFAYSFSNTQVPIILTERDWISAAEETSKKTKNTTGLLDLLLHDPALARLYAACSRMDLETVMSLRQSPGLAKLLPLAASLDYYGAYIRIRSGRVMVPGGPRAESEWRSLVGVSPDSPGEFVPRLLAKDNGWLAAYFDSLARTSEQEQARFVEPARMRRLYESLRGKDGRPGATASVFRPDPALVLLTARLQWDADGAPHVPGSLHAWKNILNRKGTVEMARSQGLRIRDWNDPEGLLEAMFAYSRVPLTEAGPCEVYLALSEVDRRRSPGHRLSPPAVELMADKFSEFSNQYLIFSEFPELGDASIELFLNTATAVGKIPDHTLRGNAMGIFQANVGLWQVLARQDQIPRSNEDGSWQRLIQPFAHISTSAQLFDAGRKSLDELSAATGSPRASQNELIDLVAGPRQASAAGQQTHSQLAGRIRAVLDDQRLVSLDTLFALGDGLNAMAHGTSTGKDLVPLAQQLQEFQMPRPIFSRGERAEWAAGIYDNRHTDLQMRTDLAKLIESPGTREHLEEARGQLVPFFRDTLVGLNYAYYEPPGSQALHNNPLLVRSHDFSGETIIGMEQELWQTPRLVGTGSPAGGGAHLVGSLADLPYILGRMEQDFVAPENVQALIWADLVPGVFANAVLPRWWDVTPHELHAVTLYQRVGEELLTASAGDRQVRDRVTRILSTRMIPQASSRLESALEQGRVADASSQMAPADFFYLTVEYRRTFPGEGSSRGAAAQELESLARQYPDQVSWERLSRDFGVPHPILARTYARELINVGPLPSFEGYSSRLLSETWDSPNLYWARLADEMGYPPVALNRLVPMLTLRMVVKIFATDLDDSPAILRAMREVGEEFRQGQLAALPLKGAAPESSATPLAREKLN